MVIGAAYDSGATVSDSNGNTWTALTAISPGGGDTFCRLWYCENPTVGSGHTVTISISYGAVFMSAFSGGKAASFDVENGDFAVSSSITSQQTGSITPTENNELVIACMAVGATNSAHGVNGGFTLAASVNGTTGVQYGGGFAYLIQTTAAAANPTFSWTGNAGAAGRIASFKQGVAGGTTRGTPFGQRGNAFNGGRVLQGILRRLMRAQSLRGA